MGSRKNGKQHNIESKKTVRNDFANNNKFEKNAEL